MLRLLIKHIIYETCISVLFEKVYNNFSTINYDGETVTVQLGDMTYILERTFSKGDLRIFDGTTGEVKFYNKAIYP